MGYDGEVLRLMALECDLAVAIVDAEDAHADAADVARLWCQLAAVEGDLLTASLTH